MIILICIYSIELDVLMDLMPTARHNLTTVQKVG